MDFSRGLGWAYIMLALELVEWVVLTIILFYELPASTLPKDPGFLEFYFYLATGAMAFQLFGILLVHRWWNRTGGILQIFASLLHLPKGEGVIGIVGGWKAMKAGSAAAPADRESRATDL